MDIVTHATTKYMDGHGSCVGGAIVDSGNFDWMAHAEKFPGLTTPDDSYHGVTYAKDLARPLHHQSHRTAYARFRLNTGTNQLVDHGHAFGVPGSTHGAPLRERAQGGTVLSATRASAG